MDPVPVGPSRPLADIPLQEARRAATWLPRPVNEASSMRTIVLEQRPPHGTVRPGPGRGRSVATLFEEGANRVRPHPCGTPCVPLGHEEATLRTSDIVLEHKGNFVLRVTEPYSHTPRGIDTTGLNHTENLTAGQRRRFVARKARGGKKQHVFLSTSLSVPISLHIFVLQKWAHWQLRGLLDGLFGVRHSFLHTKKCGQKLPCFCSSLGLLVRGMVRGARWYLSCGRGLFW